MKKIFLSSIAVVLLLILLRCGKSSDYYSSPFLNEAELAKPGMVDSLQILPGKNRAVLKFIVGPDRRVTKLKISHNSSLSSVVTNTIVDVNARDYGNYKEVPINNLPEATLIVRIVSFDSKGDSSNVVTGTGFIYGERYLSSLYNRIYLNTTTVNAVKQLNFQNESNKPRDATVFYTLQKTIVTYSNTLGATSTVEISPFLNEMKVPDIAATGTISHYSSFKPTENSIDTFTSAPITINF